MRGNNGFTLTEIAMVMVIIALVTGGVLKAQSFLDNARVISTIKDMDALKSSAILFQTKYSQYPGDYTRATTRIFGCTAENFCENGNGNRYIGWFCGWNNQQAGHPSGPVTPATPLPNCLDDPSNPDTYVETTMFFKHLALVGMITGINTAANPGNPAWGQTHLINAYSGGYVVQHNRDTGVGGMGNGQWIRVQTNLTSAEALQPAGQNPFPPRYAAVIDRKIDDGKPGQGFVRAISSSGFGFVGGPGCATVGSTGQNMVYDETISKRNCMLYFKMFGD